VSKHLHTAASPTKSGARRQINVTVTDAEGKPLPHVLVLANSFHADDWAKPGMSFNPNPRQADANGHVNFYDAPAGDAHLAHPICLQVTAMGAASGTHFKAEETFDGSADLNIRLEAVPFV
jgi:hypothetical protein